MRFRVVETDVNKQKPYHSHLKYEVEKWFSSGHNGWQGTGMIFSTRQQAEVWINTQLYPTETGWGIDPTIYIA